jgi:hypothetical protein
MKVQKGESRPKKKPPCEVPGCDGGIHAVKSWLTPAGARMQRVECDKGHRYTVEVVLVPVAASLNRTLRRLNRQF